MGGRSNFFFFAERLDRRKVCDGFGSGWPYGCNANHQMTAARATAIATGTGTSKLQSVSWEEKGNTRVPSSSTSTHQM